MSFLSDEKIDCGYTNHNIYSTDKEYNIYSWSKDRDLMNKTTKSNMADYVIWK